MNYGICGYGNIAKAEEKVILASKEDKLVAIFSRRKGIKSESGTPVYPFEKIDEFEGKIDAMIMCGGSQEDLVWQSPQVLEHFNIIDTFDTHQSIPTHRENLDKTAKKYGHVAIYSCGWDPGLFSIIRALAASIFPFPPVTFWGRGVSQGHSEALRNIKGVKDAIEHTVPNRDFMGLAAANPTIQLDPNILHRRECFVALDGTRSEDEVRSDILNIENYFKGQDVCIFWVSEKKVERLKKSMFHKGSVFCGDEQTKFNFHVKMKSNPLFTSRIVFAFSKALSRLSPGAYSVLDIPLGLVCKKDYI